MNAKHRANGETRPTGQPADKKDPSQTTNDPVQSIRGLNPGPRFVENVLDRLDKLDRKPIHSVRFGFVEWCLDVKHHAPGNMTGGRKRIYERR